MRFWPLLALLCISSHAGEFDAVDAAARVYLEKSGLPGAGVLVVSQDEGILHEVYYGSYSAETQISVASAAKWLSGATLMSVVETGALSLDDPASKYLPALDHGPKATITVRQLFNHTSGFPDAEAEKNGAATLAEAADRVSAVSLRFRPGREFLYGGGAMQLAGRVAEVAENDWPWVAIFAKRIAEPLAMKSTVYTNELNENPRIAGGVRTTLPDYGNFLTMLLHEGEFDGKQILKPASVREIITDSTRSALKNPGNFKVNGFAAARNNSDFLGYGVGCWIDAVAEGETTEASSPGAFGFIPWINIEAGYAAIWMIEDRQKVRRTLRGLPDMRALISEAMAKR